MIIYKEVCVNDSRFEVALGCNVQIYCRLCSKGVSTSMPRHAGALHPRREINKKLAMAIGT